MKFGKGLRKTCALVLSCSMIISAFTGTTVGKTVKASGKDYNTALLDGVTYYDAQKCGKDAGENNAFSWRSACHGNDGADVGLDLSGGYHDCGDHVKFGITQGYAASVLEWGYYEYADAYQQAGASEKTLQTLKHFCDYFLKCHPNMFTFYYQCGNGDVDHSYWGAPELQEAAQGKRETVYKVDSSNAGSDVCGEASAALALMYLNYKSIDSAYAEKCLSAAKTLYSLGRSNLGLSKGQSYYNSTSYYDDLAWAATWLYKITGSSSYLTDAETYIKGSNGKPTETNWAMCWNDMWLPTEIELYKATNSSAYLDALKYNINYWVNDLKTTNGGLKYLTEWGVLRYVAAESMVAIQYYGLTKDSAAKNLAVSQINYILGDNPKNMSYVIGYGSNYPKHPHQRAANGYGWDGYQKEAKYVLLGGLVGGPDASDNYSDDVTKWQETEGGIDYNAGFVGAVAGIIADGVESHPSQSETPATTVAPTTVAPTQTVAPTTVAPTTVVPTTVAPTQTAAPTTVVPTTVAPTQTVAPTTVAPSSSAPTTVAPTQTVAPSSAAPTTDVSGVIPSVKLTTQTGSSINQTCTISSLGSKPLDLSKLVIRYYYSKSGSKAQSFWCDSAGLQLSVAPYYVNLSSDVKGTFHDGYLEITFDTTQTIATGTGSLNMGMRFAQADWSAYSNFADKGYEVYYNGVKVAN